MSPSAILATLYGEADAKHGLGYFPRPFGFEKEYRIGFHSAHKAEAIETPPGSYLSPVNWGWY